MSEQLGVRWQAERPWKGILWATLEDAGVHERDGLVVVPYRLRDGRLFRERYFAPDGRTWWGPQRHAETLIPFGVERLPRPAACAERALLLAEGESDALALREAFADVLPGAPVRGYDVLGLPGARSWRPEWRLILKPWPLIYVIGDGDEAGRGMNALVRRDVPWARPVRLPIGEDARSLLQTCGSRALDPYLDQADADAELGYALITATSLTEFERILAGAA